MITQAKLKADISCAAEINDFQVKRLAGTDSKGRERGGLLFNVSDRRIQRSGVRTPLGSNRVVSLSKAHLLPKSTGNTQEAVAPSQHD